MSSPGEVIVGKSGDTYCRPTKWTDVGKFFILNYVLHVLTVLSDPGSRTLPMVTTALTALFLPFSGVVRALEVIYGFARGGSSPLQTALRAGALCMVIPTTGSGNLCVKDVSPRVTNIHGQYPVPAPRIRDKFVRPLADSRESNLQPQYRLVVVPKWFTVNPLLNPHREYPREPQISCNDSILKAVAAIMQVIYGSIELYNARGRQIERFGYAAYSLTVIPYILMSLANLCATLCTPQYPTMFIVLYRGTNESATVTGIMTCQQVDRESTEDGERDRQQQLETAASEPAASQMSGAQGQEAAPTYGGMGGTLQGNPTPVANAIEGGGEGEHSRWVMGELQAIEAMISGAVGEAYGEFQEPADTSSRLCVRKQLWHALVALIRSITIVAPYIVIYLLTRFENAQSTVSQRAWIMVWLVFGQVCGAQVGLIEVPLVPRLPNRPVNKRYIRSIIPNTHLREAKWPEHIARAFGRFSEHWSAMDQSASLAGISEWFAAMSNNAGLSPTLSNAFAWISSLCAILDEAITASTLRPNIDPVHPDPITKVFGSLMSTFAYSVGAVGGFIVVAKMILDHEVCSTI